LTAVWLFTVSSVIAGLGILFAFKRLMKGLSYRIKRNEFHFKGLQKDQIRFFIQVGLIEAVPIFLIILGFMFMGEENLSIANLLLPLLIILAVIIFSLIQIQKTKAEVMEVASSLNAEELSYVKSLSFIGYMTVLGIPILAIVAIFLV
jgi:surface polysaccharide O-acyltransferase-like enzyme